MLSLIPLDGYTGETMANTTADNPVDLEMDYFKVDAGIELHVRAEKDGDPAANVPIKLFLDEIEDDAMLERLSTGEEGMAMLRFSEGEVPDFQETPSFTFIAKADHEKIHEEAQSELTIQNAHLELNIKDEDEREIKATLLEVTEEGELLPVEGEEVFCYVERLFGMMEVEEFLFTDEDGSITCEIPDDIIGDEEGNLNIVTRLEEHPDFGNIERSETLPWGKPREVDEETASKAMWAASPPAALVITIVILVGGVWVAFFFVFYQLRKISKTKA